MWLNHCDAVVLEKNQTIKIIRIKHLPRIFFSISPVLFALYQNQTSLFAQLE